MISNLSFDPTESRYLQKSFAVDDEGVLRGFLSGHEYYPGVNTSHGRGFATTFKSREWLSLRDPDGLCSMVTLPAVRAIVEVTEISSHKGITAWVPELIIVGVASSVPSESPELNEVYDQIPRYDSETLLQAAFDVERKPSLKMKLFGR